MRLVNATTGWLVSAERYAKNDIGTPKARIAGWVAVAGAQQPANQARAQEAPYFAPDPVALLANTRWFLEFLSGRCKRQDRVE
jgi:hypothetical protein